jgi:Transglycosylase SLT domain/LysM domain
LRRTFLLLIIGIAFFCGLGTAHLIQSYVWNQGVQVSIDFKLAKPTSPEQIPAPSSPESASAPARTPASPPLSQVSGIQRQTVEKKFEPGEEGTKQAAGFQDAGQLPLEVASFKEPVPAPSPAATTPIPEAAPQSKDVAGVGPQEVIRPTKEAGGLQPGPQPQEVQVTVPEASLPQETGADGTKNLPATSANNVAREIPAAGTLLGQIVVQKGDSLGKIITQYYPKQEKLGLQAIILANPEISREDVIFPGQTLKLPRINVSAQAVQLPDQLRYALYGSYYSAASWEGDKPWLEKNQVRFLVRETRESTGRVIHRVFLGGYEKVSDLMEAQRRLSTRGKRAWQGNSSLNPVGSGSTTAQEQAFDGAVPVGLDLSSPNPVSAVECQPNPVSPGPSAAPEVKGATRLEAREMVAGQSPLEHRFEEDHPQAPLMQFNACMKDTAAVEWIIGRCRNVLGSLRYLISLAGQWQNLPFGNLITWGKAGGQEASMQVSPEILPPENGRAIKPDLDPESGVTSSPSPIWALHVKGEALVNALLSRYREILGVLLVDKISHFPEHLLQPVASKEEQEPLIPLPEPDSPKEALPAGTIRRYWDANGVLHIVNGELIGPNLGTAAIPVTKFEPAQPSEWEQPDKSSLMRNVSWPGQGTNPMPPVGLNDMARTLPPIVEGSIQGFLDARGVLHIGNGEPKAPIAATTTPLAKNPEKVNEEPNRPAKPVSFPNADQLPAAPVPGFAEKTLPPQGGGTILRFRDSKGVLHIKTVEYPKPEPVAAQIPPGPPTTFPDAGAHPWVSPVSVQEGQGLPRLTISDVVAFRDPQGQLIIRNQRMETKGVRAVRWEETMAQLAPIIQEASLLYGLPVPLIQAVIKVESNFSCWAVSPKGAMGLMQLMPDTAASLGVKDPFNPRENIHGGCRYLRLMLDYLRGSLPLALAAYNAGYQRVVSCGFQIPAIQETQGFVTEVLGRYQAAQNMGAGSSIQGGHIMPVAVTIPK